MPRIPHYVIDLIGRPTLNCFIPETQILFQNTAMRNGLSNSIIARMQTAEQNVNATWRLHTEKRIDALSLNYWPRMDAAVSMARSTCVLTEEFALDFD